ncbi:metallophosphoesterase [Cereibacter sphaeroides]|nr:metallophosphoesterase [Cereibacter sphaeroides]
MTRIVHLSDLHFGAHDPALIDPLLEAVHAQQPDLTVISGDYAQRGTISQFREARHFVERLPEPHLSVPGNHDLPHFNPILRFLDPYGRFRKASGGPEEPVWYSHGAVVAGINTADRTQWMRGKVTPPHIETLRGHFDDAGGRMRIAVMHHPLEHAALNIDPLMIGADNLRGQLPEMGVSIVLSGHIHVSHIAPFRDLPGTLFVQNGTSLSTRRRGEANVFLTLDIEDGAVQITRHYWGPQGFVAGEPEAWELDGGAWGQPQPVATKRAVRA